MVNVVDRSANPSNLGRCEGDCDDDSHCGPGLVCFQRNANEATPGCTGGEDDGSRTDYCVYEQEIFMQEPTASPTSNPSGSPSAKPTPAPTVSLDSSSRNSPTGPPTSLPTPNPTALSSSHPTANPTESPSSHPTANPTESPSSHPAANPTESPSSHPTANPTESPSSNSIAIPSFGELKSYGSDPGDEFPLGVCEGDCDEDAHCAGDLICFQREKHQPVPGCRGSDGTRNDYCIDPSALNTPEALIDYIPGKLTVLKDGLLLSQGLDARLIANSDQPVGYTDGSESNILFHGRPDAGATFRDDRLHNQGGWVYVSNSEMETRGEGGVGALTFDKNGNLLEYKMILEETVKNCGGGRTPWNTWVSCEEAADREGFAYQVDPFGNKEPQKMVLGGEGGRWESFAYDIRNEGQPHFYITEDDASGAMSRFTPSEPDWNNKWDILHGVGTIDYLKLNFESPSGGTFAWTPDKEAAMENARNNYPNSEGIDVYGSQLFFVCKGLKMIYKLDLDMGTWSRTSTVSGLFEGQPDQLQRLIQNPKDLLFFTEEGSNDSGIHARDENARFYTIMESPLYRGETTGLSLSPDGRFMYVAYQDVGKLFCLWRRDGKAFGAEQLDVKFHQS
jgi:hypothetical protein